MIDLSGKVLLVTGGSRGIGAATVRAAIATGAKVVLHFAAARDRAEAIAHEAGASCRLVQASLEKPGEGVRLWQESVAAFGHIDVLINNAGVYERADVDGETDAWDQSWQRTLQINLVAAADLCREAIRHFRPRAGGTIINVASRAAFRGDSPDYMNYAASKGGMIALTRTIARGFARDGVLAYAVAPGFAATEVNDDYFRNHDRAEVIRDIPIGDIAPAGEIANIIVFLASGLARHATGSTVDINGASYMH